MLGIELPDVVVCDDHSSPFNAFARAYFAEAPISVWKASRGFGGKTFNLAGLSLTEQITLNASITLLGGSQEQSKRVHKYLAGDEPRVAGQFWDCPNAPDEILATDPSKSHSETELGGEIIALAASQKSVRGPHPQRMRLDEVDEMELDILEASLGQTMMAQGVTPQTVLSSTHQHADGTMTKILEWAKENGWPVDEWCYRETLEPHGWLPQSEVDRKRNEVTISMWENEYELQEPEPEDRAIDPQAVEDMFVGDRGRQAGDPQENIILIEPDANATFYHGGDWAKSTDWTVVTTWADHHDSDFNGLELAAWMRMGRQPWPAMINAFNERVKRYGGKACHDATGVGEVVDDYLEVGSASEPFDFRRKKERDEMLSSYIAAIEHHEVVAPRIEWMYRDHKTASLEDVYGSPSSNHLPDSISSAALGHHAYREWRDRVGAGRSSLAY